MPSTSILLVEAELVLQTSKGNLPTSATWLVGKRRHKTHKKLPLYMWGGKLIKYVQQLHYFTNKNALAGQALFGTS
jgi:hypothetical protein